jgi:tripartite ATP-independent transporter DctP family solute receptor
MLSMLRRALLSAILALAAAPAPGQTVLKMGYTPPSDSHFGVGARVFCDEIDKGTQGRYRCRQYPDAQLGGGREMIEAVQLGRLDMVLTSSGPLGNFVPEVKILDIPFLFRDYAHARKVLDGPIGQELLQKMQSKGLVGLAWSENGFRHMTNNRRPIVSASDAAGLKLRTMENRVHMAAYRTFGVQPVPMPFPGLYAALQRGSVDGEENPIPVILASKFWQVQKYLSLTGHVYSPAVILMSSRLWQRLSEPDRQVFAEAARKSAQAQRHRVDEDERNGIAQLKREGMQVVEQVDRQSFREAVAPAYADFAKEFGADKIAAIQAVH